MNNELPQADSTTIVIFGASGDLTHRKLIPALFHNRKKGRLWDRTRIVGVARREWTDDFFRARLLDGAKRFGGALDEQAWNEFAGRIRYIHGDLEVPGDYAKVDARLRALEGGPANRLYYLATAPEFYGPACDHLAAAGMAAEIEGWRRIIIEKPFGHDLTSAVARSTGPTGCGRRVRTAAPSSPIWGPSRPRPLRPPVWSRTSGAMSGFWRSRPRTG